ncbi:MAG: glutaredoxin domain-containing protein [Polyangiaceae bacterium]
MPGEGAGSGGRRPGGARDVLLYTRTGCMFCKQVEDMLGEASIVFHSQLVEDRDEQDRLCQRYGAISFPLVLSGSRYVGGFMHIVKLYSEGRLGLIVSDDPGAAVARSGGEEAEIRPRAGGLSGYAAFGAFMKNKDEK